MIVDDDGRIQGFQEKPAPGEELSNLGNCGIYVFEPEIFDYFPDRPFVDWAQDVFPALLDQDVALLRARDRASTGTTSAPSRSTARATSTRSRARSQVETPGTAQRELSSPATPRSRAPVFIGDGCEIASGVRLTGPVVIGERSHDRRGRRAARHDRVARHEVDPGTVLIGAVAGDRPLADKLSG